MSQGRFRLRAYHPILVLVSILILAILACGDDDTPVPEATSSGAVATAEPTAMTEVQNRITVVFGEEPIDLGVSNIDGCTIIPAHFPCMDAMSDALTYIDSDTFETVPLSGTDRWEQIEPNRWRFHLRDGVKFHNGEPLTSVAIKAALDHAGDPDNVMTSYGYTGESHGELVDGNDLAVDAVCTVGCPIFPRTAFLLWAEAPEYLKTASLADRVGQTVGYGPYKMVEWRAGQFVDMEKYEDYLPNDAFDSRAPTINEIHMLWRPESSVRAAMVQVGEADWVFDLGLEHGDTVPVFDHGGAGETFMLQMDTIWHPELKKQNVRLALAHATDCDELVATFYDDFYECHGNLAPPGTLGLTAANSAQYEFNPELAEQLLDEGNYDSDNEIIIRVFAGRFYKNTEVAEAQAQMWREVGVNVRVSVEEAANWSASGRVGCGRATEHFLTNEGLPTPDDYCLSLEPGPPNFVSMHVRQLNPSNEQLDFSRTATSFMNCEASSGHICDPVNIQPLLNPALEAVGEDRRIKMEELATIMYDQAYTYTYFNAEVFYGYSESLNWTPRFDRRLRVNTMDFTS